MCWRALRSVLLGAALTSALPGCGSSTLDSLGNNAQNDEVPASLRPVVHPAQKSSTFCDLLGGQACDASAKVEAAFQQLFHGTQDQQRIFFEDQAGPGKSSIVDVLHQEVRAEGIGLAMLISVELNHKKEFDELWLFTKSAENKQLLVASGPAKGYISTLCGEGEGVPCYDVYAMQQMVLALMLANARWGSTATYTYENDALSLLDVLKNKEAENGGVVSGIGSVFSPESYLVREDPELADAGFTTRSSLQMPAAYWYWGKATGMPFWDAAAEASRKLLVAAADPSTGLWPMRSYFDGALVDGSQGFTQQAYRTQLNLALDAAWGTATDDQARLADRVLDFFSSQGITTYGGTFETDGTPIDTGRAQALVSANGALAVAARTNPNRKAFVQAVWNQPTPTGDNRYYEGLLYLTSLVILSGQMQVY